MRTVYLEGGPGDGTQRTIPHGNCLKVYRQSPPQVGTYVPSGRTKGWQKFQVWEFKGWHDTQPPEAP